MTRDATVDGGPKGTCTARAVYRLRPRGEQGDAWWDHACSRHLTYRASVAMDGERGEMDLDRLTCDERG